MATIHKQALCFFTAKFVLNIRTFEFCICFGFRYSDLGFPTLQCWRSTLVENPLQISSFAQNKPNSQNHKINPNLCVNETYEDYRLPTNEKTNPIQTQYKPNQTQFSPPKRRNKPNSNPIQTQFPLPQTRHPSQLPTAEIKPLFRDYRIMLFYLIYMQRIEYLARNNSGQSLSEGQGCCSKTGSLLTVVGVTENGEFKCICRRGNR